MAANTDHLVHYIDHQQLQTITSSTMTKTLMPAQERRTLPWVKTPLIHSTNLSRAAGCQVYLKLENLQPSGSFKSRGVGNYMLSHLPSTTKNTQTQGGSKPTHFYIASGGNAGLACVYAAKTLGLPATVIVPLSTSAFMISKLQAAGANQVIQHGKSWAEANIHLKDFILPKAEHRGESPIYVPPFDAQTIWDGNATLVHELVEQFAERAREGHAGVEDQAFDAVVCSVGGGGLLSGVMQGLEDVDLIDRVKVLALETRGADSLSQALAADELITMPAITSIATHLGCARVCERVFEFAKRDTVKSVVLDDKVAVEGCRRFVDDERILVEPACGVCIAVCYEGRLRKLLPELREDSKVVIVVCGGSAVSLKLLDDWSTMIS